MISTLVESKSWRQFHFHKTVCAKVQYILTMTKQYSYELLAVTVRYEFKCMGIAALD